MVDSRGSKKSTRENLIELYHKHLSKRYKRYYDPESNLEIPPTPAKKLCQRKNADSNEEEISFSDSSIHSTGTNTDQGEDENGNDGCEEDNESSDIQSADSAEEDLTLNSTGTNTDQEEDGNESDGCEEDNEFSDIQNADSNEEEIFSFDSTSHSNGGTNTDQEEDENDSDGCEEDNESSDIQNADSNEEEIFSFDSTLHSNGGMNTDKEEDENQSNGCEEDNVSSDIQTSSCNSPSSLSHYSNSECESSDHLERSELNGKEPLTEPGEYSTDQDEQLLTAYNEEQSTTNQKCSNAKSIKSYHKESVGSSREGHIPNFNSRLSRSATCPEINGCDNDNEREFDNPTENYDDINDDDSNGYEEEERESSEEAGKENTTASDTGESDYLSPEVDSVVDDMDHDQDVVHDPPPNFAQENPAGPFNEANRENPVENNFPRQRRNLSLRDLINGDYSEPVDAGVDITRSDLLYMALGTAKQNNFTNKAFNDNVQLLNSVFEAPVLPLSSKRLDGILLDKEGVKYFFYCKSCQKAFGELDYKNIKTKVCENVHCGVVNEISDLRKAHYFCMFDLTHAIEDLFNQSKIKDKLLKPEDAVNKGEPGFICDIYSGSMYKDFARRVANYIECVISLHFCTDGAALFKSSLTSIWPVMFCINELPPVVRMKNIVLGGLWFGKCQPPMNLLLEPLSQQAIHLSNGFRIQVKNEPLDMRAFITGCCVDSGARGKVQGMKGHGGYYSCNWCDIKGVHLDGAVKYPMTEECPKKRTHEEILRLVHKLFGEAEEELSDDERSQHSDADANAEYFGVQDASPLINVPMFDMADGFFVDPMHLLDLGITKGHLVRWLEEPGDFNISGSTDEIDKRLISLRPPLEFRRMPRKLHEKARAKARELNNWLLYCMYPVLIGILPQKYLKLWLLFAQAVYLLSQTNVLYQHVNTADSLLKYFICKSQQYYGETCMVFNMHLLSHLAAHVARWGPLWATSAYCFENFNGFLLKIIQSHNGIPHQIIRALSWKRALHIMEPFVSEKARQFVRSLPTKRQNELEVDGCLLLGNSSLFSPSEEEMWFCERMECDISGCEEYAQLARNNCVFSKPQPQSKTNNSVAQLTDKSIVLIRKIVHDRQKEIVFLFASKVIVEACISLPRGIQLDLADHCIMKVVQIEEELCCLSSAELKIVCFFAESPHGNFVLPLANVCNTF